MIPKYTSIGVVLCLILCSTTDALAQGSVRKLSLEEAVRIGLEHNPTLRAARQDVDASKWGLRRAYTNWLPKVDLSSGYTRLDDDTARRANAFVNIGRELGRQFGGPDFDPDDIKPMAYEASYSTGVTVLQRIYNGGAEWSGIRLSKAARRMSLYALRDAELETTLKVKRVYLSVLKAQEIVALTKEAMASTERHLGATRRMLEVGSRNRADVLRWEVQLAQDRGNVVEGKNGLSIARAALNEAMGVDLGEEYELIPVSTDDVEERTPPEAQIGQYIASHPTVKITEANVDVQRASVRLAQGGFQPKVNLAYNYNWEQDDDLQLDGEKTWSVSVQVNMPIFHSFGTYSGVRKAKADLRKAEVTAEGVRRGMMLRATSASLNLNAARTRIGIARKGVEGAEENLRIVRNMYEVGNLSNIDFIDAQLARNSARTNLIHAVYDYYIAEAELGRALGSRE